MSRPKRIDLPFSLYHVFSRSNSYEIVFQDHKDQEKFLEYLEQYVELFSYRLHAWCLLPTHFHILLESTDRSALSELMRRLLTAYTIYYNRRHGRHGHLFQGRFKSFLVDKKNYLLTVSRYIHLNPARLKNPAPPETYKGSSLYYYIQGGEPEFLYTKEILSYFKGQRKKYAAFVREGMQKDIKLEILYQCYLGDDEFAHRMRKRLIQLKKIGSRGQKAKIKQERFLDEKEIKQAERILLATQRVLGIPAEIIKKGIRGRGDTGIARAVCFFLLREQLPWTIREIMRYLGLKGNSGMSYYIKKANEQEILSQIRKEIKKE